MIHLIPGDHRGPARYIGRVGALAFALGVGAAVIQGGVASADTTTGEARTTEASTDASPGAAGSPSSGAHSARSLSDAEPSGENPPTDSDPAADAAPSDGALSEATDASSEPDDVAAVDPEAGEAPNPTETTPRDAAEAATPDQPDTPRRTGTHSDSESALPGTVSQDADSPQISAEPDDTTAPDSAPDDLPEGADASALVAADAGPPVLTVTLGHGGTHADPVGSRTTDSAQTSVRALAVSTASDSESTTAPAAPLNTATLAGFIELLRRELQYRLFNRTPRVTYDPMENSRNVDGQIVGTVNGTDADGDVLTYRVSGAARNGSVTLGPGGAFTYTPNAALAAYGGTDTFVVTVSDVPGNRFHLHGLNTVLARNAGSTATARVSVVVPPAGATEVSPLGTVGQLAAERLATQIVDSPLVKMAKAILKWSWLATARKKFALVGGPDAENLAQLDRAVDEYALQAAFELQLLNPNNPGVIQQVMPPHTWYGQSFGGARILFDNPDTVYRMIPVNNASSYVISGRFSDEMPTETTFSVLTGLTGTTTQVLMGRDLVLDSEKRFTISVDSRAVDPDNPNHLRLPSGATLIAARNTLGDWNTEQPMSLSVERVGGPPNNLLSQLGFYDIPVLGPLLSGNPLISRLVSAIPALSPMPLWLQQTETAIVMALGLIMEPQYMAVATQDPDTGQLKPPNTMSDPTHNASFLATQQQSAGYFQLADDQALVITIDPGNAGYFIVPITNDWTITDNYWDAQTSLNNFQAVPNADGVTYTIVVSPTDPGVANWVSTGGLNQGTLSIRFQDLDLSSPRRPAVSTQVVSVADVLPPGEPPFTEAQRAAQIALRQSGYNKRYAPYPQTV